jgi:hypothetical protein
MNCYFHYIIFISYSNFVISSIFFLVTRTLQKSCKYLLPFWPSLTQLSSSFYLACSYPPQPPPNTNKWGLVLKFLQPSFTYAWVCWNHNTEHSLPQRQRLEGGCKRGQMSLQYFFFSWILHKLQFLIPVVDFATPSPQYY